MHNSHKLSGRLATCLDVFLLAIIIKDVVLQSILERIHLSKPDCLTSKSVRLGWSLVNSWRDQVVWCICYTRGVGYWQPCTSYDFVWNLKAQNLQFKVRPLFKLLIDVAQDSRQKFNLTVSAKTLVYKQVERIGKSSNGHLRSGGGLLEIMG